MFKSGAARHLSNENVSMTAHAGSLQFGGRLYRRSKKKHSVREILRKAISSFFFLFPKNTRTVGVSWGGGAAFISIIHTAEHTRSYRDKRAGHAGR